MPIPQEDSCKHCRRTFPRGTRGLRNHLKQSRECQGAHQAARERQHLNALNAALGREEAPPDLPGDDGRDFWPDDNPIQMEEFMQGSSSGRARSREPRGDDIGERPSKRARVTDDLDEDEEIFVQEFPIPAKTYGHKLTRWEIMRDERLAGRQGRWGGFESQEEWEFARWLMKCGVSQGEIDKLLKLPITKNRTKPSFHNKRSFLKLVDALPTSNVPGFECEIITVQGTVLDADRKPRVEVLELWKRDPIECVREILGNPALRDALHYEPEKVFTNGKCEERIYHEAWTAEWWWDVQEALPPGATIASIILASDKTQLSQFGGDKVAYPVYLTLGNVAKGVRRQGSKRATVLLGYLPVSKLACFPKKERKEELYRLFHYSMSRLLAPLVQAGKEGVKMTCADGFIRKVYPILFAYVGDHPEQCLITCCKQNRCPKCRVARNDRGEPAGAPGVCTEPRVPGDVKKDLRAHRAGTPPRRFKDDGLHPIYAPFWADLPYCNIFSCITPDLLHQIHKGVFNEHLVDWCRNLAGEMEVDNRCRAIPDNVGLRHFKKGISTISQWTGTEAKHLESIFVGLIASAPDDPQVVAATRSFVDFIYYASYTSHTTTTLEYMQASLDEFHTLKDTFIQHGVRADFNFPKFHAPQHYVSSVITHGTLDGYNTELPERLHIDLAKAGYRASNKRDYVPQMVKWLRRQESVDCYTLFLEWVMPDYHAADLGEAEETEEEVVGDENEGEEDLDEASSMPNFRPHGAEQAPPNTTSRAIHALAKNCPCPRTTVDILQADYGAVDFIPALTAFLRENVKTCRLRPSPIDRFDVFKRFKMQHTPLNGFDTKPMQDTVRATPCMPPPRPGRPATPAHFDTVLIDMNGQAEAIGMQGIIVGQVRVIFKLPSLFDNYPHPLAYVELFACNTQVLAAHVRMYQVRRAMRHGRRKAVIIRLDSIRSSCHLIPKFGRIIDSTWTQENVMDKCTTFYINHYRTLHSFQTLSQPLPTASDSDLLSE